MNPIRQIAHIVVKDIRGHALEVGLLLLVNLAFVLVATESWTESISLDPTLTGGVAEMVLQIALLVLWSLLIAQVIQTDTPCSREAYWLTRPLSRLAVPGAKVAFVLLVVHLPTFAAQAAILILSGVPLSLGRLLLNQAVILAYLSLPMMLIAALTRSLAHFVLAVVACTAIVLMMMASMDGLDDLPEFMSETLDSIPLPIAAWMFLLALVAGMALFWQYCKRQILVVASCCAALAYLFFRVTVAIPGTFEHWTRIASLGTPTVIPEIGFRSSAAGLGGAEVSRLDNVALPLELSSPDSIEFQVMQVHVRTIADPERKFETVAWLRNLADGWWLTFEVPNRFFEDEASIRLIADSVEYEMRGSNAIPLDGSPAIVDGRAQCGAAPLSPDNSAFVFCRTSFRHSDWRMERGRRVAVATDTREPFRFSLDPIMTERVTPIPAPDEGAPTELATNTRTLTGYARQVVEIERIRLADWAIPPAQARAPASATAQ